MSSKHIAHIAASLLVFAPLAVHAQVGPPTAWELYQNDPNPFCANPGSTRIEFTVPQSANIQLVVTTPDGTQVLRTLVHGVLAVGLFTVIWDGRNTNGMSLPNGTYPYRMTATDAQSNVLFVGTRTASVECFVGVLEGTWKSIKQRYR